MNRKYIGAVLAVSLVLSGCAVRGNNSESPSEQSTSSLASTSTSSSRSEVSSSVPQSSSATVSVPEASSSTTSSVEILPETSTPEVSSEISSSVPEETPLEVPPSLERDVISVNETGIVASGETLYIESGKMLVVEGSLTVESGAVLNVTNGAELLVEGSVQLDGDLILSEGGKLIMGSDNAWIDGGGSVVVVKNFEQIDCEHGTVKTHITPPERVVTNGVTTVGGVVIANKAIKLPPEYGNHLSLNEVEPEVYSALEDMRAAANHWFVNRSGYRSYWEQQLDFQYNVDLLGFERADVLSARAGHSEHQTGLTLDLDSFDQNYCYTPEGKWLAENCWRYGFIIRYPKGKEHITGYDYEPWHVRYLGKSTAKLVFDSGLTLEEFLNVEGGTVVIDN